jgi:DNA-binding response OmpR family regulator
MAVLSQAEGSFFYVLDEPLRLLFVDDDPILREFALVHLSTANASVETAADGLEAWSVLRQRSFDMLLLDLEMPNLDGFAVLERMRADPNLRDMPVIVVTGREDVSAVDRAFTAGATSFVVKPLHWRLLSYQIRFVWRAHRVETSLRQARQSARAEAAKSSESMRTALTAGARLLSMAMRGDEPMREAAREYGELLSELAEPVKVSEAA